MSNLKTIKVKNFDDVPENFSGIAKKPNGTKIWYKNGKFHRENGPTIISVNGIKSWWINDICLTKGQYKIIMMFSEESREKLYENDNRGLKNLLAI